MRALILWHHIDQLARAISVFVGQITASESGERRNIALVFLEYGRIDLSGFVQIAFLEKFSGKCFQI